MYVGRGGQKSFTLGQGGGVHKSLTPIWGFTQKDLGIERGFDRPPPPT